MHPYAQALYKAVLSANLKKRKDFQVLAGDVPSPLAPPKGCAFHPRCPYATSTCSTLDPHFELKCDAHFVACHHAEEIASQEKVGGA